MKKIALLIAIPLFLMACATAERGRKFDTSQVNKIEVGKTSEAEVLAMMGAPYRTTVMTDGSKELVYGYAQASGNMFARKIETSLDKAVISFDKAGIVKSIERTGGN